MFKYILPVLALCATLADARNMLWLSGDAYSYELDGDITYFSDAIYKAGYLLISLETPNVGTPNIGTINNECAIDDFAGGDFSEADPEAFAALNSTMGVIEKAIKGESEKILSLMFWNGKVTTLKSIGYPEPKQITGDGYNITVLDKGHCYFQSEKHKDDFFVMVINKETVTQFNKDDTSFMDGIRCESDAIKRIVDEVKAVASDC